MLGQIWAFGDNDYGQLGVDLNNDGSFSKFEKNFRQVNALKSYQIKNFSASKTNTFYVTEEGRIFYSGQISAKSN